MKTEIHILMLEDSEADAEVIAHTLRKGGVAFTSERVETRADFARALEHRPPDLILSDYSLPSFDGYAALALAQAKCPDTPFIFVTGTLGEEVAIETLKRGATDYVLKHRLSRIVPSAHRALRELEVQRGRRRAEEQLRQSHEQLRALSLYLQHVREEERIRIAREVHDEYRVRKADGQYLVGEFTLAREVKDGKPVGVFGIGRDITEHKRTEEALQNLSRKILQAQEDERRRISRELHDEVGQSLTAISVELAALRNNGAAKPGNFSRILASTQRLLQGTMNTVHDFARELRPAMLDELGLLPALRSHVKSFFGTDRSACRVPGRSRRGSAEQ